MLEHSVIRATGQTWKLVIAVLALLVGSFLPLYEASGLSWTGGTILAIAGYAFGVWFIRCPDCGERWFWQTTIGAAPYGPLFKAAVCPDCARGGNPEV